MRFAVIPTIGRDCLGDCIDAIGPQVDRIVLINNSGQDIPGVHGLLDAHGMWTYTRDDTKPPNLSRFWNWGLREAEYHATRTRQDTWDVAVLNDDAIVPDGWFEKVASVMRENGCAAACSGGGGPFLGVHHHPGPVPLNTRMTGWAFMLAGEKKLRADENLHWWFGDDDLDWQARQAGCMVMLPGLEVPNLYASSSDAPNREQIALDAQAFHDKWGMRPW